MERIGILEFRAQGLGLLTLGVWHLGVVEEVGLSAPGWLTLANLGLTSVGKAAYSITSPGEPVTESVFRDWVADHAAGLFPRRPSVP